MKSFYLLLLINSGVLLTYSQQKDRTKPIDFSKGCCVEYLNSIPQKDRVRCAAELKSYLQKAKKNGNTIHLFHAYNYYVQFETDRVRKHHYADSLWMIASRQKNNLYKIKSLQVQASLYHQESDYEKALNSELAALDLIDRTKAPYDYHKTIYAIGRLHYQRHDYQQAALYFEAARSYFEKIDEIDQNHSYSSSEIKNAYTYLIAYYKLVDNNEKVLYYTDQLLRVTLDSQPEFGVSSHLFHQQLHLGHLEIEKKRLEQKLKGSRFITRTTILIALLILTTLMFILTRQVRKHKADRKRCEAIQPIKTNAPDPSNSTSVTNKTQAPTINNAVLNKLLKHLEEFEKNEEFLNQNTHLNDLAEQWNTNRNYLSICVNTHKKQHFIEYINSLRINYLLKRLDEDYSAFRHLKIKAIGFDIGFSSARSFSQAFVKVTDLSPSHYLSLLEKKSKKN